MTHLPSTGPPIGARAHTHTHTKEIIHSERQTHLHKDKIKIFIKGDNKQEVGDLSNTVTLGKGTERSRDALPQVHPQGPDMGLRFTGL